MTDHKKLIEEARSRAGLCSADAREAMRDTGDIVTRLADALAAPVQVDEAKLAAAVRDVIDRRPYSDETRRDIRGLEIAVARAVAEWLRAGGR